VEVIPLSFELPLAPRTRAGSRLIARVRKQLTLAALEAGASQQSVADKMEVNRSVINRLLRGTANLTLRTVGELAWALDLDVIITFTPRRAQPKSNVSVASSNPLSSPLELRVDLAIGQRDVKLNNIGQTVTRQQIPTYQSASVG
jgi:transcriptional regulator with XRE-family HTH domain